MTARAHLFAVFLASASPVMAASLPVYVPGGAPCDGACNLDWARSAAGVPPGEPTRRLVPAGSVVEGMSYSKAGVAYWTHDRSVLLADEPGVGYEFEHEGRILTFFKLDVCENWAVFDTNVSPYASRQEALLYERDVKAVAGITFSYGTGLSGGGWDSGDFYLWPASTAGHAVGDVTPDAHDTHDAPNAHDSTSVVPVAPVDVRSTTGLLLLAALTSLLIWRAKR